MAVTRDTGAYRQLQRIVDGAVRDAFAMHPEYLTRSGRKFARGSITKRVAGSILGYAEQSAQGRSDGQSSAADQEGGAYTSFLKGRPGCPLRLAGEASGQIAKGSGLC